MQNFLRYCGRSVKDATPTTVSIHFDKCELGTSELCLFIDYLAEQAFNDWAAGQLLV